MKKFIFTILTLALTVCSICTLTACGGNKKGGTPPPTIVQVESVSLDSQSVELYVNDAVSLTATITPSNATDKTITWATSDPIVATVENGLVTAVGEGSVTITATSNNGKTASCEVVAKHAIFTIQGNTITGLTEHGKTLTDIVIPSSYKNTSITTIGEKAFYKCSVIKSITIPQSITSINSDAFLNCTSLNKVNYLGSVDDWAGITFATATSNPIIFSHNLYINNVLQSNLVINAQTINAFSFYGITVNNITIGENTTAIGENALCTFYKTINVLNIGANVKNIGASAFNDSFIWLTKVYYSGDASGWASINFDDIDSNPLYNGANLYLNNNLLKEITINSESVNNYAFYNCDTLTNVTFGENVKKIGKYAFNECTKLTTITMPSGLSSIGEYAFNECTKLTTITIPSGLSSIGRYAFYKCNVLSKVNYLGTIDNWVSIAFETGSNPLSQNAGLYINDVKQVDITINAEKVNDYAFIGYSSLNSVTLGNNVKTIGNSAFYGCLELTRINMNNNLTAIGNSALAGCYSLANLKIPNSVTSLGTNAFGYYSDFTYNVKGNVKYLGNDTNKYLIAVTTDNTNITSLTLDDNCKFILEGAFQYCKSLKNANLGKNIIRIGERAFQWCTALESLTIPGTLQQVGTSAFYKCTELTRVDYSGTIDDWASITFESGYSSPFYESSSGRFYINGVEQTNVTINVPTINACAFIYNRSLKTVTLGSKVTKIGVEAFGGCGAITTLNISQNLSDVDFQAFAGCFKINKIYYQGTINDWVSIDFDGELANPLYCNNDLYQPTSLYINEVLVTSATITAPIIKATTLNSCKTLTSVVISSNVTQIGDRAFKNCTELASITFEGTIEEWEMIEKGENWKSLVKATFVQCSNGEVPLQ